MIVVADTSPLNYLIQIHREHFLPALYGRVLVPSAVFEELRRAQAVPAVLEWLEWTRLVAGCARPRARDRPCTPRPGPGRARSHPAGPARTPSLLLMDERLGVRIAREQGLEVTGTLGVLVQAARQSLIDIESALTGLR